MSKIIKITAFLFVSIIQLLMLSYLIGSSVFCSKHGKEYKFLIDVSDPYDICRGKYLYLSFVENNVKIKKGDSFACNDIVYALLEKEKGFAKLKGLRKDKPKKGDYIKVKVNYINMKNNRCFIEYPFNKYFMNEKLLDNFCLFDLRNTKYKDKCVLIVKIYKGDFSVKGLYIDGKPIEEFIRGYKK